MPLKSNIKSKTFPAASSSQGTLLTQGFNLPAREEENSAVKANRDAAKVRIIEEGSQVEANRSTIRIAYDPDIFKDMEDLKRTFYTYNHLESRSVPEPKRAITKHRLISSDITLYGNGQGEKYSTPATVYLTSGCAPNFMGNSAVDINHYLNRSEDGFIFKDSGLSEYETTMTLIFKRLLYEQDLAGVNVMILPLLGGGVYLAKLTEAAKKEARQAITRAFQDALKQSSLIHIKKIIYTIPDVQGKDDLYQEAAGVLADYQTDIPIELTNADMLDAAKVYSQNGKNKVGLINPGSDRTIGGRYEDAYGHGRSVPGEETIFSLSDAGQIQAANNNTSLLSARMEAFPGHLRLAPSAASTSAPAKPVEVKATFHSTPIPSRSASHSASLNTNSVASSSTSGVFIPFRVDYKKGNNLITAKDQALKILEAAKAAVAQGYKKVGITYGANSAQTTDITSAYPKAFTDINGTLQAAVMKEMHALLQSTYSGLNGKVYILPITTIIEGSTRKPVTTVEIERDQLFIEDFIKSGGVALGWQNQDTYNRQAAPYPIAEGNAAKLYAGGPVPFFKGFQEKLIEFAATYKPSEALKKAITEAANPSAKPSPAVVNREPATEVIPASAEAAPVMKVAENPAPLVEPSQATVQSKPSSAVVSSQFASAVQSENKEKDDLLQPRTLKKIADIKFTVQDKVISLVVPPKSSNTQKPVVVDVYERKISEAEAKQCGSFEVQRQRMITKDTDIQVIAAMIKAFMEAKPGKRIIITPKDTQAHDNFVAALDVIEAELRENKADVIIKGVNEREEYKATYSLGPNEHRVSDVNTTKAPVKHSYNIFDSIGEQKIFDEFKTLVKQSPDQKITVQPKNEEEYALYTKVFAKLLKNLRDEGNRLSVPFEIKGVGSKTSFTHTPASWLEKEAANRPTLSKR